MTCNNHYMLPIVRMTKRNWKSSQFHPYL